MNARKIILIDIVLVIVFGLLFVIFNKEIFLYFMYTAMLPLVTFTLVAIFNVWVIKPIGKLINKLKRKK